MNDNVNSPMPFGPELMANALADSFGTVVAKAMAEALKPIEERLAVIESTLTNALNEFDEVKHNGGLLGRMLGG